MTDPRIAAFRARLAGHKSSIAQGLNGDHRATAAIVADVIDLLLEMLSPQELPVAEPEAASEAEDKRVPTPKASGG